VAHGEKATASDPDPTKNHHTFKGWHSDEELEYRWNFDVYSVTGDMTLYAKWEKEVYTVSFDDGDSVIDTQPVPYGGKATRPPTAPTKEGYTFVDWYSDTALTVLWDFPTDTVTGNMTLYAKWKEILKQDSITINGELYEVKDTIYYPVQCGDSSRTIEIVYTTVGPRIDTLRIDATRPFRRDTIITLISEEQCTLILSKSFEFDSIAHAQLGGRLLMVVNNPKNNNGFVFQAARWRKRGERWSNAASKFYYISQYSNPITDTIELQLLDSAGTWYESCPYYPTAADTAPNEVHMAVYPNPVLGGAVVRLKEEFLIDLNVGLEERYASLYLLDVQGKLVYAGKPSELRQGLTMPATPGAYYLVLEGKAGRKLFKVTVL
jgi:uncharacterized repeat protein (TIGR02543 family)